ncbi:DUF4974 domain-containing protein [Reichenbachiella carrageenanivorans]|uniref:DUF4974 domain-containing protein n=1 Tax=Reichenbachiella carrageenanivorans TaxID=2979869 RepID=A0ABY6CYT1_9BACT|nr:FecR family protein [Reichenbachiella carrageenanivorans]UXX79075.1 DUF4974 domain-containing protein [Reichenbachiella carrageenanivorans]
MKRDNIYVIISRHLANSQDKEDEQILQEWVNSSEKNREIYEGIKNHWQAPTQMKVARYKTNELKNSLWEETIGKNASFQKPKETKQYALVMKIAASLILIAGLAIMSIQYLDQPDRIASPVMVTKSNIDGVKTKIHLKDGTVVQLNSDSQIAYAREFSDTARTIWLEGEAFFNVAKSQKPFYVICDNIKVRALGTSFNVYGHTVGDQTIVSLSTGKVSVTNMESPATQKVFLDPGQQVTYDKEKKALSAVEAFDPVMANGWKDGVLSFNQAALKEIIQKLSRWYGVSIQLENNPSSVLTYTGSFERQSLHSVLTSMGYVNGFQFEIEGKNVQLKFDAYEN